MTTEELRGLLGEAQAALDAGALDKCSELLKRVAMEIAKDVPAGFASGGYVPSGMPVVVHRCAYEDGSPMILSGRLKKHPPKILV